MSIDRARLFDVLAAVPFERGRWVVAGSGPLLAMSIVDAIEDIDIVADARAWLAAIEVATGAGRRGLFGDHLVALGVGGLEVEVFDGWLGIGAGSMIAEAVEIDGYLFAPLDRVAESKRTLGRPNDIVHLARIEALLGE
jgi:hypothetical protein